MDPDSIKLQIDGLLHVCKWISGLLLGGVGISLAVVVLRLTNQVEFTAGQVKLRLAYFPYVVGAFTIAHAFLTWVFAQQVETILANGRTVSRNAWNSLTTSEAFLFFNMKPRVWNPHGPFGLGTYVASAIDAAFWATSAFAALLIIAVIASLIPASKQKRREIDFLGITALGCTLASVNWVIGSRWAIQASALFK